VHSVLQTPVFIFKLDRALFPSVDVSPYIEDPCSHFLSKYACNDYNRSSFALSFALFSAIIQNKYLGCST
jgi:hypothetical protein